MNINDLKMYEGKFLKQMDDMSKSPVTRWLDPKLIEVDEHKIICEFVVKSEMKDPPGMLHGGIRATMLSDVLGIYANALKDDVTAVTTSMNVDFIGKAYVGDVVNVVGKIDKFGSNLIYMSGIMKNEKGDIVARGTTTLFVLDKVK